MATAAPTRTKGEVETHPLWVKSKTYPDPSMAPWEPSKLESCIGLSIDTDTTIQTYGPHGTGKSATVEFNGPAVAATHGYPDATVVVLNAANVSPDEMQSIAPEKLTEAERARLDANISWKLRQLISSQFVPGKPFILFIDDSLQAGELVQNQFMQITCNWKLGQWDLRELGCIAVILTDNESLAETAAKRTDMAQLGRMATYTLTANDMPWRLALAARYVDFDLKPWFQVWNSLSLELRTILSPRTQEHMLDLLFEGFPMQWALPMVNGKSIRLAVANSDGKTNDRTKEIIDRLAASVGTVNPEETPGMKLALARKAIQRGWKILWQSNPGYGKTSVIDDLCREAGVKNLAFSMPVTDVDQWCSPLPTDDGRLETVLAEEFLTEEPKVLTFDEYNRVKAVDAYAKLMEVTQRGSLGGVHIVNVQAMFALQNPPYVMGKKSSVSKNNIAQADRFTASVELHPNDLDSYAWLINKFPEKLAKLKPERFGNRVDEVRAIAEVFVEWHKFDLDDDARQWISPRDLERMMRFHLAGAPMEPAKIYLGEGEYAPVPLGPLEARLADRPMTGLKELSENLAVFEAKLAAANEISSEGTNDTDAVHTAFANAETSQLWEHIDTVVALLKYLPPKLRGTYMMGCTPERQQFWIRAFGMMSGRLDRNGKPLR